MKLKIYSFMALMLAASVIWASEPPQDESEIYSETLYKFTGGRFGDNILTGTPVRQQRTVHSYMAHLYKRAEKAQPKINTNGEIEWPTPPMWEEAKSNKEILARIAIREKIAQLFLPPPY